MRKLTGYIGAIIIVFALMGSILLGYALNVNGTTTTVNAYDPVTDVSGLYTHSQEPAYIDYNPASNYIGYSAEQAGSFTINNTTSANRLYYQLYKETSPNCAWNNSQYSSGAFYNNGSVVSYSTSGDQVGVRVYYVMVGNGTFAFIWQPDGTGARCTINANGNNYQSSNFTITYSGSLLTYTLIDAGNATINVTTDWLLMPKNGGNYAPIFNSATGYYQYENMYYTPGGTPAINTVDEWNGEPVYNLNSILMPGSQYWAFVPSSFNYEPVRELGINYTESNRVNNYPVVRSGSSMVTQTSTITVGNLSATDYWPQPPSGWIKTGYLIYETQPVYPHDTITAPYWYTGIMLSDYNYGNTMLHQYKLSDVLANYTIPVGTQTLKITTNSNDIRAYSYYNLDANIIGFVNASNNGFIQTIYDVAGQKDYLIYDISNNICTVYDYNGVSLYSNTPENIGLAFCDNTGANYMRYTHFETVNDYTSDFFTMTSRPVPFITITANVYNPADIDYLDITKGYSIKTTNTGNVTWDNEYNNGVIRLLFRAENTNATYHNGVIVGDNSISITYNDNRYYISLNSGDPVDTGTWRNIVLEIDLINGKLSAIPVKTFNSYTNVELMNTPIIVGDLVNPTPTNSIEWAPTSNSLNFNVYSTTVNMNTYGVVMVDPSLNVQNYFTNLDNFYRLNFYNFSTYGNSITINGITSSVTNGTVTYEGETIRLKDLNVTYADGHTYIGDSNLEIDLGETTDYNISMTGAWYFETILEKGYTELKNIYEWDWGDFILDNTQFCIIYMGLALVGLVIARHFCNLSIIDYSVLVVSAIIAFTVQVVA